MTTWDYLFITDFGSDRIGVTQTTAQQTPIQNNTLDDALKSAGAAGWEIVTAIHISVPGTSQHGTRYIFKRPSGMQTK